MDDFPANSRKRTLEQELPRLPMFPEPPTLEHLLAVATAMDFVVMLNGERLSPLNARARLQPSLAMRMLVTLDSDGLGWTAEDYDLDGAVLRMRSANAIH